MIEAFCITNVDGFTSECWPKIFGTLPRLGDQVSSCTDRTLHIVAIIHGSRIIGSNEEPVITIRLAEFGDVPILKVQVVAG